MRVLIDTNVILDLWLAREPFWPDAAALLAQVENRKLEGWICPTTVTTLHYLAKKELGEAKARKLIRDVLHLCQVGNMNEGILLNALDSQLKDYEDAVIEAIAVVNQIDLIATRNLKDFRKSKIEAREPATI
jgi:predicted nucleic acid-binding protein